MTTQDQLEMALQVADTTMGQFKDYPPKIWDKELDAVAYKLARVAGLINNDEALQSFKKTVVETIKRRHGVTA